MPYTPMNTVAEDRIAKADEVKTEIVGDARTFLSLSLTMPD